MKKLVLAAAVLLGGIAASQAGLNVNIDLGFARPHHVIIGRPAPVVVAPAPACQTPVVVAPPACPPSYAPVVVAPRYGYYHRPVYSHHGHGSHGYSHGHDRHDDRGRDNRGWYGHNNHGGYGYRR